MKKLVIITQKVDSDDDLLGFFVEWISEFAKYFERIEVITLGVGRFNLPSNVFVHSLGKEHGGSKWRQALRFLNYMWRYGRGAHSIFAHMSPIFAVIAWPFAWLRGSKLVLWYLHRSR